MDSGDAAAKRKAIMESVLLEGRRLIEGPLDVALWALTRGGTIGVGGPLQQYIPNLEDADMHVTEAAEKLTIIDEALAAVTETEMITERTRLPHILAMVKALRLIHVTCGLQVTNCISAVQEFNPVLEAYYEELPSFEAVRMEEAAPKVYQWFAGGATFIDSAMSLLFKTIDLLKFYERILADVAERRDRDDPLAPEPE